MSCIKAVNPDCDCDVDCHQYNDPVSCVSSPDDVQHCYEECESNLDFCKWVPANSRYDCNESLGCHLNDAGPYVSIADCREQCIHGNHRYKCEGDECVLTTEDGPSTYGKKSNCEKNCKHKNVKFVCGEKECTQTETSSSSAYDTLKECNQSCAAGLRDRLSLSFRYTAGVHQDQQATIESSVRAWIKQTPYVPDDVKIHGKERTNNDPDKYGHKHVYDVKLVGRTDISQSLDYDATFHYFDTKLKGTQIHIRSINDHKHNDPSSWPAPTSPTPHAHDDNNKKHEKSIYIIAGTTISVVVLLIAIGVIVTYVRRKNANAPGAEDMPTTT